MTTLHPLVQTLFLYFVTKPTYFKIAYSDKNQHQPCTTTDHANLLQGHLDNKTDAQVTLTEGSEGYPKSHWRVGVYPFDSEGLVRWLCIDFDGGVHHSTPLKDPLGEALKTLEYISTLNLPAYLECSGSGSGWHIWIFFASPVSPEFARTLGLGLCPTQGVLLDREAFASPLLGQGIEVFPKSWTASPKGGASLWLPWWSGAKKGANQFYGVDSTLSERVYLLDPQPTSFEKAPYETLVTATKSLPPTIYWKGGAEKKVKVKTGHLNKSLDRGETSGPDAPNLPDELEQTPGKDWRERILETAPLEVVYAPFLTGKATPGWLTCRDFRSPSGDENPSAGVSDGSDPLYPRGLWHSFRDMKSLSIFDYLIAITEAKVPNAVYPTFKEASLYLSRLCNLPYPKPFYTKDLKDPLANLPMIFTTRQQMLSTIIMARDALVLTNEDLLKTQRDGAFFLRADQMVQLYNESIRSVTLPIMMGALYRSARWVSHKGDDVTVDSKPPQEVASDILSFLDPRFRQLDRVMAAPLYSPDGVLCWQYGYHEEARAYITYQHNIVIPDNIHEEDAKAAARWLLTELFADFSFATEGDATHAIGALLTPLIRDLIPGATPPHDVGSPTGGCGKDLLVKSISTVYLGKPVAEQGLPIEEAEIAKTVLAEVSLGQPIVLFTNADTKGRRTIDSGTLEALWTSNTWKGRILGTSNHSPEYPNRALWFVTGVNLKWGGNLPSRRIRIRLDPKLDTPRLWSVYNFKRPGTDAQLQWVKENRGEILTKLITMVQYYFSLPDALKPKAKTLGNYESWSRLVGSIVEACGLSGWMAFKKDPLDAIFSETGDKEWMGMFDEWMADHGGRKKTAEELNTFCHDRGLLFGARRVQTPRNEHAERTSLGKYLSPQNGVVYKTDLFQVQFQITKDTSANKNLYELVSIPPTK